MKNGSRMFRLKDGMKVYVNNGYCYKYVNNRICQDIFIEYELVISNIDGIDHQIEKQTGNTYTSEQLNEKYPI